jgi:hypothetical protein
MLSMAKLIMHLHVCIACFRFPVVNLAHIAPRALIAFSDDALNPPCIIVSAAPASTRIRRRYRCVNLRPSFSSPNTTRCPLLFAHDGR